MQCAVIGAGTIGHLAARVLAMRQHAVTVFDTDPERLKALNGSVHTSTELHDLGRFDCLIEATGKHSVLTTLLDQLRPGAQLLLLGLPYASHVFNFESLVAYDRAVIGSVGSTRRDFDDALAVLPTLDVEPFMRARYPLESYEDALAAARARVNLKVMLTVDGSV